MQRIEKMLSGMLVRKPIRLDDVSDLVKRAAYLMLTLRVMILMSGYIKQLGLRFLLVMLVFSLMHQKMERRQGHIGLLMHQKIFLVGEQRLVDGVRKLTTT